MSINPQYITLNPKPETIEMCCIDTCMVMLRWIQTLQVLTQMLLAESRLSKAVFDSPYAEAAFDEIVSKHAIDLTKSGQAILQSKRSPDKVVLTPSPSPWPFPFHLWLLGASVNLQPGLKQVSVPVHHHKIAQHTSKAY